MSHLCCCIKSITMNSAKKVNFDDKVTVVYFKQEPIDTSVNWQQAARDSLRFERRIFEVENKLNQYLRKIIVNAFL